MELKRPLVYLDCETTGVEPAIDRIITIYLLKELPSTGEEVQISELVLDLRFNPQRDITPENTEIHGMTNEMVKDWPLFDNHAQQINSFVKGCDFAGFNTRFDLSILFEELYRCGITMDLKGVNIVDAGMIFKLHEERSLTAAVKFYCKRDHAGAHGAREDVLATRDVLNAQINRYPDLLDLDVPGLAKASQYEEAPVDLNGTIVLNKDGVPVFNTKRNKGIAVCADQSYAAWICRSDFPTQTKQVIRGILGAPDLDDPFN